MKFRAAALAAACVLASSFMAAPVFAQSTPCGTGNKPCTVDQVGPFMQGVSNQCGNLGTCNLCDIEIVLVNIGTWILGIVGSLVLLFYVWGGIQLLASGSGATSVQKGKKSITTATVGLIIVFVAYIGIHTIAQALGISVTGGTCGENVETSPNVSGGYVHQCTKTNQGASCDLNAQCVFDNQSGTAVCEDLCDIQHPTDYTCLDTSQLKATEKSQHCVPNLCRGGANLECCDSTTPGY